ncbi:peptidase S8/S53 domain-containing protein [Syncephalis pseudoplumigaleata]|uniref:Peptidase S8/S53 domain-containing protein n=1 Tax=Syncephalis pseudoplumigaleata TaxID=1712513 RepID=A0A4P9YUG7_9FUNG|nr:peptidase S8/S53 domain-containing protein [Syncephalis pseudoplumigaleata]|eukprot:RKP22510.1 peptidase S8/S53 domain-containing protein [Syncephalis pseudoplumigaleata]
MLALRQSGLPDRNIKIAIINDAVPEHHQKELRSAGYKINYLSVDGSGRVLPGHRQTRAQLLDSTSTSIQMAGILALRTSITSGIVPGATINIYNAFGTGKQATTATVLPALQHAVRNGAQVITMPEIVTRDNAQEEALRIAIEAAEKDGAVILVAASGHNFIRASGSFSYAGLPVISVGGYSKPYQPAHWFEGALSGKRIKYTSPCRSLKHNLKPVKILNAKWNTKNEWTIEKYEDTVMLVANFRSDVAALLSKAEEVQARGVILAMPVIGQELKCSIPLFVVNTRGAKLMKEDMKENRSDFLRKFGNIKSTEPATVSKIATPRGSQEMPIDPDILAPSTKLLTFDPHNARKYTQYSGISGAVAYAAGTAALLLPARQEGETNTRFIKRALQNNAYPIVDRNGLVAEPTFYQGAGMINAERAYKSTLSAELTSIDLGKLPTGAKVYFIMLRGCAGAYTCKAFHLPAKHLYGTSGIISMRDPHDSGFSVKITFSPKIRLMQDGRGMIYANIQVPINIPQGDKLHYSGYIGIDQYELSNQAHPVNTIYIPYKGVAGQ